MKSSSVTNPRAEELLIERALRPLSDREHHELHELGCDDDESFDAAAAALALAMTPLEAMPQHLADKILAASPAGAGGRRTLAGVMVPTEIPHDTLVGVDLGSFAPPPPPQQPIPQPPVDELAARRIVAAQTAPAPAPVARRRTPAVPWLVAAACLAIASGAVWRSLRPTGTGPVAANPTPADARAALLASAKDISKIAWTTTKDPTAVAAGGDVVWSQAQQRGFMRFTGLVPNDPKQFQYQLWIFDKTRDQAFPVDGGVFDVSSTGEVIIPISAKLMVADASLFAVTVEKPGGVVVSKRERIVVTAARA